MMMKRSEVWWVDFDPSLGSEIQKTRPAVIVSNDFSNKHASRVQVIPLTSNTEKLYPSEAYLLLNGKKHKAMADQIMTVSKKRLKEYMGTLEAEDMFHIGTAIKIQVGLFEEI